MDGELYIRFMGRVSGPFDLETLQSMMQRGQFGRMYEVSEDGYEWKRAETIPSLFPQSPADLSRELPAGIPNSIETETPIPSDRRGEDRQTMIENVDAGQPAPEQWYMIRGGQSHGPYTRDLLEQYIREGRIGENDLLATDPQGTGSPAKNILGEEQFWGPASAGSGTSANSITDTTPAPKPPAAKAEQEFSMLAIGSVVVGICWLFGLGSIAAIVLGGLAFHQVESSAGKIEGRPIAIAGIVIGFLGAVITTIYFCY